MRRQLEPVVLAIAGFTPRVELTRPGVCALPARAPARYFGGEASFVEKVCNTVAGAVMAVAGAAGGAAPEPPCRVGIADGPFAARLAAREGVIVPHGEAPEWLRHFEVEVLGLPLLADVLGGLVRTLGEFAEVDEGAVLARSGSEGGFAHRLARGLDEQPLALGDPPADLTVCRALDPPADRADALSFVAVGLADELVGRLGRGACRYPVACRGRDRTWRVAAALVEGRAPFYRPGHGGQGSVAARGMAAGTGHHRPYRRGHHAAAHCDRGSAG